LFVRFYPNSSEEGLLIQNSRFLTLFHVFAKAEWSMLVSMCAQWPIVKYEVRSSPSNEYGLDPRATRLTRKI